MNLLNQVRSQINKVITGGGDGFNKVAVGINTPNIVVGDTLFPVIGFGTSGLRGKKCVSMVATALAIGYRHIDTAQAYKNEADVGKAIANSSVPREDIFLTTKLEQSYLGAREVRRATADSLARLGTDYIDLLMIHWPSKEIPMQETLSAFAELRDAGKIRNIGVCNFTLNLLREAVEEHGATLLCNQIEYHPLLAQDAVLNYLQQNGIVLTAYSPLGRGKVLDNPVLRRLAKKYGKTPAQISLAWLVSQHFVAAIPKASSEAHCRANLEIFDFELSPEDKDEISGLRTGKRVINPTWAPDWD